MAGRVFHGWWVIGACFTMALVAWTIGFYGMGVYLVHLRELRGWSEASIASAITAYYFIGAGAIAATGWVTERIGARRLVLLGACAYALGLVGIAQAPSTGALLAAFALIAVGWGASSSTAINIVLADWFERRRGMAVSLAMNGASFGGVLGVPALVLAIQWFGFERGLYGVALLTLAVLVPLALFVLVPGPGAVGQHLDGASAAPALAPGEADARGWSTRATLVSRAYWTITIPFALCLAAQVAILTFQISILEGALSRTGAAFAVSLTGAMAVVGRLATGLVLDRFSRRRIAAANFALQAAALVLLALATDPLVLYGACAVFGLGVGNLVSLPGLLVQREFPPKHFARTTSLVVSVCQLTYATGPAVFGAIKAASGGTTVPILACAAAFAGSVAVVLLGGRAEPSVARPKEVPRA